MYFNSIIIITSDHGEEFFEHGNLRHGKSLYEEQLKVPLIIRLPDKIHMKVDEIANQVDICPTILSLLKIPAPRDIDGIDLFNDKKGPGSYSYAELHLGNLILSSIQTPGEKFIEGISLPKKKQSSHRWFKENVFLEIDDDSLELSIMSFYKDRRIRVLSDGKPIDEFVITKKRQVFNILLPPSNRKKMVTIKSLTPCQIRKDLGISQNNRCLAFCIFNSRNVNVNHIMSEVHKEYYVLEDDPEERNNRYHRHKFKKTIVHLRKKLKEYKLHKRYTHSNRKPVAYDKEQLKALKALGYIE